MALAVFYGSQTGCAESIAKRIYDEALEKEIEAVLHPLNDFQSMDLLEHPTPQHVILVCSTTGNGDPPDNAAKFWRYIKRRTQPKDMLEKITYAMLGLGDTNYDKFCYMGKSIDKRMRELSAQPFYDMCAADEAMGLEDQVEPWLDGLWEAYFKSVGANRDCAETCSSSSDGETTTAEAETTADAATYLPENLVTYEKMFGPFDQPTETPEDVPRLQSSLYTVRFLDETETVEAPITKPKSEEYGPTNPFTATIKSAKYLTKNESERKVLYLTVDITGSHIVYRPGDSVGIKCPNRAEDVDALLRRLELDGAKLFCVEPAATGAKKSVRATKSSGNDRFPSPCSVRDVFLHHVDLLSSPKKAALRALATHCTDEEERARMLVLSSKSGADKFKQFISDQQINFVDLLYLFPSCQPPLDHLLSLLPQLMPRFYSITTSPLADSKTLGITFTIVDERVGPHAIPRRGLCTMWLESICQPLLTSAASASSEAIRIPIFLRQTRDFLLPASHEWPLLLIGPGTGVAPFMGFLQHRYYELARRVEDASSVCSGYWRGDMALDLEEDAEFTQTPATAVESKGTFLFFGCRHRDQDWIFEDEMKDYLAKGTLRQLFTAFSREQEEKHYVQHELKANGALVADLVLQQGGYIYVCGDGTQMAKDVHAALTQVLEEHAQLSKEEAEQRLGDLAARQRYVRDIW
ncbi:hypothetical protein Poli38472_003958 [Pythium oligandrum]|uniref:Methionine synthase reductase n=1 Tax=Pythium oligandrum TaxID=41045 RepID=A0A8K1FQ27_PYTOL|nr:hypothetical protein Poli38472_003958 [Pythium oligandrum]|eukprot:TMW66193.1 hypothetical protein Poli38472_003958 [Pythium oligandrum]